MKVSPEAIRGFGSSWLVRCSENVDFYRFRSFRQEYSFRIRFVERVIPEYVFHHLAPWAEYRRLAGLDQYPHFGCTDQE